MVWGERRLVDTWLGPPPPELRPGWREMTSVVVLWPFFIAYLLLLLLTAYFGKR